LGSGITSDQNVDGGLRCESSHEDRARHGGFGVRIRKPRAQRWDSRVKQESSENQTPGHAARVSYHVPESKRSGLRPMEQNPRKQKESPEYVNKKVAKAGCNSRCFAAQQYQERG